VTQQYPTYLAGQTLTAALLTAAQPVSAVKASDTPRSSTTTLTADPELTFSVLANGIYIVDGWIKYTGDPGSDITISWTVPTGAIGEWSGLGVGNPLISVNGSPGALIADTGSVRGYMIRPESTDFTGSRGYGALSTTDTLALQLEATLRVGSSDGTFALNWAQSVSSATATTVYTDSWLRLQRIQ
jgi:hypothetical protein